MGTERAYVGSGVGGRSGGGAGVRWGGGHKKRTKNTHRHTFIVRRRIQSETLVTRTKGEASKKLIEQRGKKIEVCHKASTCPSPQIKDQIKGIDLMPYTFSAFY